MNVILGCYIFLSPVLIFIYGAFLWWDQNLSQISRDTIGPTLKALVPGQGLIGSNSETFRLSPALNNIEFPPEESFRQRLNAGLYWLGLKPASALQQMFDIPLEIWRLQHLTHYISWTSFNSSLTAQGDTPV